ncbi:hypothetical protein GCM10023350_04560 [Nocardioides endophyticus]|uniref:Uncharacterized protein n=1 Tax=Nocardioides endophyticus TaxID=1353775 RepID=A0ABP8YA75_9ACTN
MKVLALGFAASGTVHPAKPEVYLPLMPSWVPAHKEVIVASVLLLLGAYPGNIKMAVDSTKTKSTGFKVLSFARLPFQLPARRSRLKFSTGGSLVVSLRPMAGNDRRREPYSGDPHRPHPDPGASRRRLLRRRPQAEVRAAVVGGADDGESVCWREGAGPSGNSSGVDRCAQHCTRYR